MHTLTHTAISRSGALVVGVQDWFVVVENISGRRMMHDADAEAEMKGISFMTEAVC